MRLLSLTKKTALFSAVVAVCALILATPLTVQAKRVESEKAQKVAQRFADSKRGPQAQKSVRLKHTGRKQRQGPSRNQWWRPGTGRQGGQEDTLYYVFDIDADTSGNGGFIIVAGDDAAKPVLGYSDHGSYDEKNLPPQFVYWMEFLQGQIAYAQEQNLQQSEDIQKEWDAFLSGNVQLRKTTAAVAPLIKTTWGQGSSYYPYPYNNMCPMDGSNRGITGCVATAMAQIMNYHNHPAKGIGQSQAYTTRSKQINVPSVNLEVNYDWNNMLNSYTSNMKMCGSKICYDSSWNKTQANAVATLMYHAGVSVQMDYSSGSSGAYPKDVPIALRDNFGYDMSTQLEYRFSYSDTTWEAMLKEQIDAGMPVFYGGYGSSGGHAFICDGYDNSGKFHFNWGWNGSQDGYFVSTALTTNNGDFSILQNAVINIKPAPPTITAQPTAQTIQFGQTTQFTVAAALNGASSLSYQWQVSTNGGSSFSNLSSATSATYSTPTATVAMSGYSYRCVVKNNRDVSVTSNSATLTVNPIPPTVVWPTAAAITYGNTLSSSTLSGGSATGIGGVSIVGSFSWSNGYEIPMVANNGYDVTFMPNDNNYTVTTKNSLAITVNKANPAYTVPVALTAVYGDSISSIILPEGWSWDMIRSVGAVGTQIHKATFTPANTQNYNVINGIDLTIIVAKAVPVYIVPIDLTATYGDSLSSIVLPENWLWDETGTVGTAGTRTHKATFTPIDTGNYNIMTGVDVTVTVAKVVPPTYTAPANINATYGDYLSSIALPEGWSWEETGMIGNAGIQIHKAIFTPIDTENYSNVTGVDVPVTVAKAAPVYTVPIGLIATYGDVLSSVALPEGWLWDGTGTVGNAGTRTHKATFIPADIENYNVAMGIDVAVTVTKATPSYTVPTGLTATFGDFLSSIILPEGWYWEETGTVGNAGTQTHKATFTPTDTWNYNTVTGVDVMVTVNAINVLTPIITAQPVGDTVKLGKPYKLTVLATVGNGGTRSYQWYNNTIASRNGGNAINGATSSSYSVPTSAVGTYYYYVVVTNTIPENGDGGIKSASATSDVITVVINSPNAVKSSDRTIPNANSDKAAAAVAPLAPLTAEFTAGPNPANRSSGTVNFFRHGSRVAYTTLSIYDASGNIVKKIRVIDDAVGSQTRRKVGSWNLRDSKGRQVTEGTYLVKGVIKTSDGKKEKVSVVLGVVR